MGTLPHPRYISSIMKQTIPEPSFPAASSQGSVGHPPPLGVTVFHTFFGFFMGAPSLMWTCLCSFSYFLPHPPHHPLLSYVIPVRFCEEPSVIWHAGSCVNFHRGASVGFWVSSGVLPRCVIGHWKSRPRASQGRKGSDFGGFQMWDGSTWIHWPSREPLTPVRLRSEYALVEGMLPITQKAPNKHVENENGMHDEPGPCKNG